MFLKTFISVLLLKYVLSYIKVGLSPSKKICIISLIESPLKMMRNGFCFDLKTIFVLKIFKFLSQLYGQTGKKNEPVNYLRL